jgi:hypothetical protein
MDSFGFGIFTLLSPTSGGPTALTYTVTTSSHGIVTGSIYDFKVVAVNDKGSSIASPVLYNIMAAQLPTVPVDL